ncbi:MAG: hypothetical protein SNJ82_09905 [Gemmataceae bacterium]
MTAACFVELARRLLAAEQWVTRVPLSYREGLQRLAWEIFQGHLVATRQERTFWGASVCYGDEGQELFSLYWDEESACVHVVRCVKCYLHEPVDGPEGLTTREIQGWQRELIASLPRTHPRLERELRLALQRAVWGARLPLTAEEAPHPLFTFGQLVYGLADAPLGRQLEARLRLLNSSPSEEFHAWQEQGHDPAALPGVIRTVFEDLSLTPWTDLPRRLLDLVALALADAAVAAWYARLLLLLTRHLTAYDLQLFHHGGLNYPDALLIEELFARLLRISAAPTPLQRLALRQGWLLQQEYAHHPVPAVPTSPGELARVLPGERPDTRRTRVLFADALRKPLDWFRDGLSEDVEELGSALYLDRPLGVGKRGIEPDATPLVASLLYSASLARKRWQRLTAEPPPDLRLPGVPLEALAPPVRAACLSLSDARRTQDDWVIRRTLPGSLRRLRLPIAGQVFARTPAGWTLWDASYRVIGIWPVPESCSYIWHEGVEWPAERLW